MEINLNNMINETDLEFNIISSEEYRIYHFSEYVSVRVNNPTHLHVSESGGHRLLDSQGLSHYVPPGWVHLVWKVKK